MESHLIIMVIDPDDPKRVEITSVDNATQAARMVETMLEAGFDQSRIRIFEGIELEMQVAHRPVVSLLAQDEAHANVAPPPPTLAADEAPSEEAYEEPAEGQESEEPFVQNGVRFSSLFKPAQ